MRLPLPLTIPILAPTLFPNMLAILAHVVLILLLSFATGVLNYYAMFYIFSHLIKRVLLGEVKVALRFFYL